MVGEPMAGQAGVRAVRVAGCRPGPGGASPRGNGGRVPPGAADRGRRDGRGVPRHGRETGTDGRAEGRHPGAGRRRRVPRAVHQGVAGRGGRRPSAHHPCVRGRRGPRDLVPRDAVRVRRRPRLGAAAGGAAARRAGRVPALPGRVGPRRGPRGRARAPGREAGQRPRRHEPGAPRPPVPVGLRARQGRHVRDRADRDRAVRRHDRLHRSRADLGRAGACPDGPVRPGLRGVHAADRAAAVRQGSADGRALGAPERSAAVGDRVPPRPSGRRGPGAWPGAGQGPGGQVPQLRRFRRRAAGRAGRSAPTASPRPRTRGRPRGTGWPGRSRACRCRPPRPARPVRRSSQGGGA